MKRVIKVIKRIGGKFTKKKSAVRKITKAVKQEYHEEYLNKVGDEMFLNFCTKYPNIRTSFSEIEGTRLKLIIFKHFAEGKSVKQIAKMGFGTINKIKPYEDEYKLRVKKKKLTE